MLIKILPQDRLVPGPDEKRDPGGKWLTHHIRRGDIFVTRSRTPNEARFRSPAGEELETISIHVGIDSFRAALEASYPGNASEVEVIDFFGRDVALSHLCAACAELLSARVPNSSRIVADLTQLFATYLVEKYTSATSGKPEVRGGLPIRQLQKVGDFVMEHLAEEISVEILAELVASYSPSAMRIECVGVDSSVHGREHVADDIGFHQLLPSAQGIPAIDRDRLTDDKA